MHCIEQPLMVKMLILWQQMRVVEELPFWLLWTMLAKVFHPHYASIHARLSQNYASILFLHVPTAVSQAVVNSSFASGGFIGVGVEALQVVPLLIYSRKTGALSSEQ